MLFSCYAVMFSQYFLLSFLSPFFPQRAEEMGVAGPGERATVCREGCAMSCAAMLLGSIGIQLNGTAVTPGSFNSWLRTHGGYRCDAGDCNTLVLQAPAWLAGNATSAAAGMMRQQWRQRSQQQQPQPQPQPQPQRTTVRC